MVFMRDAIVSPLFDPKELERERVVVTGEIDRNEATPCYHLSHDVEQQVWWKYPSRKDPLGTARDGADGVARARCARSSSATTCRTTRCWW